MASVSWQRLIPSSAVWQPEQRDRLGMPASEGSRLSSSSVHCSTLKDKSSGYWSIQKRVWHWRAGVAERVPLSVFACGWFWSKMPGAGAQGQFSHRNGFLGYDCRLSHPGMLLLAPPLPLYYTSVMGLNCRGAVSSTESSAAEPQPFLILKDGTHLARRLDLSLHTQRKIQFPASLPTYPPLPPNPLVAHLYPRLNQVFYSLSGFSRFLPFPLRKCFIK